MTPVKRTQFKFTNQQWAGIVRHLPRQPPVPTDLRNYVQEHVNQYLTWRAQTPAPYEAEQNKNWSGIHSAVVKLQKQIAQLPPDMLFTFDLITPQPFLTDLRHRLDVLARLTSTTLKTKHELKLERELNTVLREPGLLWPEARGRRRKSDDLVLFIQLLSETYREFYGDVVPKKLVDAIMHAVDPRISHSQIDTAYRNARK